MDAEEGFYLKEQVSAMFSENDLIGI